MEWITEEQYNDKKETPSVCQEQIMSEQNNSLLELRQEMLWTEGKQEASSYTFCKAFSVVSHGVFRSKLGKKVSSR